MTHPVGQKKPNALGLYDMIGNAGEWVGTIGPGGRGYGDGPFVDYGSAMDVTGFLGQSVPYENFIQWRGGLWNAYPAILLVGKAAPYPPDSMGPGIGLRLAQTIFEPPSGRSGHGTRGNSTKKR